METKRLFVATNGPLQAQCPPLCEELSELVKRVVLPGHSLALCCSEGGIVSHKSNIQRLKGYVQPA